VIYLPFLQDTGVCNDCFEHEITKCYTCMVSLTSAAKAIAINTQNITAEEYQSCFGDNLLCGEALLRQFKKQRTDLWLRWIPNKSKKECQSKMEAVITHHDKQTEVRACSGDFCRPNLIIKKKGHKNYKKIVLKTSFSIQDLKLCKKCNKSFCRDCCDFLRCDYCEVDMCIFCQDQSLSNDQAILQDLDQAMVGMTYCGKQCQEKHKQELRGPLETDSNYNYTQFLVSGIFLFLSFFFVCYTQSKHTIQKKGTRLFFCCILGRASEERKDKLYVKDLMSTKLHPRNLLSEFNEGGELWMGSNNPKNLVDEQRFYQSLSNCAAWDDHHARIGRCLVTKQAPLHEPSVRYRSLAKIDVSKKSLLLGLFTDN
jgi:hypothetical protein